MVRRRFHIPEEVKAAIKEHIREAIQRAAVGSVSAAEDEDTLTGHLGANLQSGKRSVQVKSGDLSGIWKWSLDYYKFRGRGPRATEAYLGADGIFELSSVRFSIRERKSLLFQAKISETGKERLLEQCLKLSTWRESAFVMVYAPDGFFALSIDDVIQSRGDISSVRRRIPLEVMLGDQFLDCDVGDFSLRYEAKKHTLLWQAMNEEIVGTRFSVKHRLRLNLEVLQEAGIAADKMIDPKTVFRYRLKADDEDLLGVGMDRKPRVLDKAAKQLAQIYHPDLFANRPDLRPFAEVRMQEINDARVRLKKRD